jgi:hypothetical protein
MKATMSKGVYNLNPTQQVMKQGSRASREAQRPAPRERNQNSMPEAHATAADTANIGSAASGKLAFGEQHVQDFYGVENLEHHSAHPAMQTRISHAKNRPHSDGRKHEEDHHAVRMAKGK